MSPHHTRVYRWVAVLGLALALQFTNGHAREGHSYAVVIGISNYKNPHW